MKFRTTMLLILAVVLVVTVIARNNRETESSTVPIKYGDVTAKMLAKARADAHMDHKYLMVSFGADWCSDCQELSRSLMDEGLRDYVNSHFVVVGVSVGQFDRNIDVAKSLGLDIVNQGQTSNALDLP
jgi:thioredoxin